MNSSPPAPDAGSDDDALALVPETMRAALVARGYTSLTPVQQAVLAAEPGRDLRVSSQTGSGKTVAFGLVLGRTLPSLPKAKGPRVLVMAPTRELALQVRHELAWLLAPLGLHVLSVTGGTSVRGDLIALRAGADVIVGTPGRLADHVRSGAVACDSVSIVVLDEADEMLDMGFADELAAVLDKVPAERSMHLVSATFAAAVGALADRYQKKPLSVQGTPPGDANRDIDHVLHFVLREERLDALVNILLLAPEEATLIFTRTREGAAELVRLLREIDIGALLLTGDLDQRERQRTLELFRAGRLRVLVATDVAARGLDIPGITRVIHTEAPDDPDAYTHRSGRTGRAGRKGQSLMLLPREARVRAMRLLSRAGITPRIAPVPDADQILAAAEERVLAAVNDDDPPPDAQAERTARRLLETLDAPSLVARLLSRSIPQLSIEPRTVTPVVVDTRPVRTERDDRGPRRPAGEGGMGDFVRFQISWGAQQGADGRRVLAMICRRGGIGREHVGSIRVGPQSSFVDIRDDVADAFEAATQRPDPRDPRVRVRRAFDERPARPVAPPHLPQPRAAEPSTNRFTTPRGGNKLAAEPPASTPSAEVDDDADEAPASEPADASKPAAPVAEKSAPIAEKIEKAAPAVEKAEKIEKAAPAVEKAAEPAATAAEASEPAEVPAPPRPRASRSKAAAVEVVPAPPRPRASRSKAVEAAPEASPEVPDGEAPLRRRPARPDMDGPRGSSEREPYARPARPAAPEGRGRFERPGATGATGGYERPGRYQPADRDARSAGGYQPADRDARSGGYSRDDRPGRYQPAGGAERPAGRYQPSGGYERPARADGPGRHDRAEPARPGAYGQRPERPYKPAGDDRPARPAYDRAERPAGAGEPAADRPARRVVRAPGEEVVTAGDKKPKKKAKKALPARAGRGGTRPASR